MSCSSGIRSTRADLFWWQAAIGEFRHADYPVQYTIDELRDGKDKELALALEMARKSGT